MPKRVVVTRTAKRARPPRVYAHDWKGHQLDNVKFLRECGHGPKYISDMLGIPLECVKYVVYKKANPKSRKKPDDVAKPYLPKGW